MRLRLALARALTGASIGSGAAAAIALGLLLAGRPAQRAAAGGAVALGCVVAIATARRRRLDDEEVALYFDAKLGSRELITTAAVLPRGEGPDGVAELVLERATSALLDAPKRALRVPILVRWHSLLPLSFAAFVVIARWPVPRPPDVAPAPGTEIVRVADVRGLEKVIGLGSLPARDDAQRERLSKIARDAEKLRRKLETGAERREVADDLARLADALSAERMSLGDGAERKGLESAMAALGKNAELAGADEALGDHDLTAFDEEMQRLANLAENDARERARQALREAEDAAKREGAPGVAKMLAEQRRLFSERADRTDQLRALAQALGSKLDADSARKRDELDQSADPKAARELARGLEKALEGLSDDERKRLADRLKELSRRRPDESALRELADGLDSERGREALEQALRDLANAPSESGESRRQRALDDAQRALQPLPLPMPGGGPSDGPAGGGGLGGPGSGGPGSGGPGGESPRTPSPRRPSPPTAKVDADDLRAHASAPLGAGAPMPGTVLGRAPARVGETANARGTGALGAVAPDEVGGVSRSEVPEEYREQIGRYFQP